MKKLLLIVFAFMLLLTTGCGKEQNIEGELADLMTKVYEGIKDEEKPMMLMNVEVNSENVESFLGKADIEYESALASESGVGSIAHSVVLVRAKDGQDVEKLKKDIKDNINPRKWICVGVEEDQVIVKNKGNLIILIMAENSENLEKGFDNL